MKQIYHILAVVLFVTGALLTSCNKVETTPEDNPELTSEAQTIQFTATLAAKGEDPQSKAITPGTDGEDKEILNVAWAAGEEIAVYYQKDDDSYATTTATVGTPNGDGSAPITATLSSPKDGGTVKFVFPATLHNGTGDIDASKLRNNQVGTLADISANFDAATGSGTLSTAAGTAVVSDKVTLTNRVCICKFSFSYKYISGDALTLNTLHSLKICAPGGAYNVTPPTTGDIYVAMLPCTDARFSFLADASFTKDYLGSRSYFLATPTGVNLTAGKFYRNLPITLTCFNLTGNLKDLSEGTITAANNDIIYQSNTSTTDNRFIVPDGITVMLAGVNIETGIGLDCQGDATVIFYGNNIVKSKSSGFAGINVGPSGKTLTIHGYGSLTATAKSGGAGIGSDSNIACGNIVISGGTVNATGGVQGAGIGCGFESTCGSITISGGTVTATTLSGGNAAGIGSGSSGTCGNITISGGTVNATGGAHGAGIGSGQVGHCGSITITTGVTSVTATKGADAPYSIGKGSNHFSNESSCGTITIGGVNYGSGVTTSPFTWPTP